MSRENFINRSRHKQHSTVSHRRAPKQEKELAKRTGGTATPGSGSGTQKGDIKKAYGIFRVEAKTTKNKSFSVTRDMLRKLEEAALPCNEIPAIIIEFIDEYGNPESEVAIVPTYAMQQLGDEG